jgi:hypothetical protein
VRCQKTAVAFPAPATLNDNDITGCTSATVTAACYPVTLRDPRTAAAYGACAAAITAGTNYSNLIPPNDRPYVQNQIPNNSWTGPAATTKPNKVTADTAPAAGAVSCLNAPVDTLGAMALATRCATASVAFDGLAASVTEAGWCYCQATGQIWANTGNNDGLADGLGTESNF